MAQKDPPVTGSERMFGNLVESTRGGTSVLRVLTIQIAIAVHAVVLGVILVKNYFEVPTVHEPPLQVSFAQIAAPPPPPPPPPPPAAPKPKVTPKVEIPEPTEMMEPIETPDIISIAPIPVDTIPVGSDAGVEGGVPGGVPGGLGPVQTGPYRVGGNVTEPVLVSRAPPTYPRLALAARIEGVVILEAVIGRDGSVRDVKVLRNPGMGLGEAAIEAVKRWRYKPGLLNGFPVDVYLTVTVHFRL